MAHNVEQSAVEADDAAVDDAAVDERAELLQLIRDDGILWGTSAHPVLTRSGLPATWMLYTFPITLSSRGGALVARTLLTILRTFTSRQLVSVGYTAIPVMSACVLFSEGEFRGATIRDTKKNHGSCRRIEGSLDKRLPVIIVDDSVCSGVSIRSAISVLEAEHFDVEGAVALVRFPWRGGIERAKADGYRVETAFDIYADVNMPIPDYRPGHSSVAAVWSNARVRSGLHPALVAREVAAEMLESGRTLLPPVAFDAKYDGRGGVFVSFRDRDTEYRVARGGFWHFDSADADALRDVVLATSKTVDRNRERLSQYGLQRLKIAVSFFGAMRSIEPCDLDFENLGVVVRSLVQRAKVGGALPNTQIFTSEVEQYTHATHNAQLGSTEPHEILVHTVSKLPEPGCYWLPYGHPMSELPVTSGEKLTARARQVLQAELSCRVVEDSPLQNDLLPDPLYGLAVSLYHRGLIGSSVSWGGDLDECLILATKGALSNSRFRHNPGQYTADEMSICVSILRDRELLETQAVGTALSKARLGVDSVGATDGRRRAIFLPHIPVHFNWTKVDLANELIRKAKIEGTDISWTTYRTNSWLSTSGRVEPLQFGFPKRDSGLVSTTELRNTLQLLCQYIVGQLSKTGIPAYSYKPVVNQARVAGAADRKLNALTALIEAGIILHRPDLVLTAATGIRFALACARHPSKGCCVELPGDTPSVGADAELLVGLSLVGGDVLADPFAVHMCEKLAAMLRSDGRIDRCERRQLGSDHDFLPGRLLLALSSYPGASRKLPDLTPQLKWYQRRFNLLKSWGMIGWHPQAWLLIWEAGQRPDSLLEFVSQMMNWAIDRQHRKTGAFLTDLSLSGPSFHTAFIMEGVADAANLFYAAGHEKVAQVYINSFFHGYSFIDRLIIRAQDTFCMEDPTKAIGGVRATLDSTEVRIDFVSHTVRAIVKALRYLERGNLSQGTMYGHN